MGETINFTEDDKRLLKSKIHIVDDERMPYYIQDGQRVYADITCNSSGAIRRLNPGQVVEVEFNFQAEQVMFMMRKLQTLEEKWALFEKFMDCASPDELTVFRTFYNSLDIKKDFKKVTLRLLDESGKRAFIQDVERHGFHVIRPPHKPLLYDDIIHIYEVFPEVRPKDIYIDLFGIKERKIMRKGIIGYEYMIVLKQNSNKNFSARSTFRVNRSNLPAKDIAKKTNRSSYARTPVRLSEIYNLFASNSGTDLAEHNIFTRSSAIGRKSLDRIIKAKGKE